MKTKPLLLVAAAMFLATRGHLPAAIPATAAHEEALGFRKFALDLYMERVTELSAREALARARAARLAAATYDLNHDGKLDERELAAWEKAVRVAVEQSPEALKRYDLNHDGKLDDTEWSVVRRALVQS